MHVKNLYPNQGKLDNRSIRCIFMRYLKGSKGYRLYNTSVALFQSVYVEFLEELDNDNKKTLDNQLGNEPTELMDDDLIYDDECIGN